MNLTVFKLEMIVTRTMLTNNPYTGSQPENQCGPIIFVPNSVTVARKSSNAGAEYRLNEKLMKVLARKNAKSE